ncbi:nucleotidyl transferase AbiEii/AbiGii toxin family protein [Pelagibacterium halotolerans]|uniref:nucleotidyl transferase AbiEii/AbiGii toxin family protein n=1 Tax=Pelagibacterium halotolerans TaxID=531813 RepID=UPI0005A23C21|nr:nucleotidyl transferase AbiEii/AbiGii toxin family protein [Pelagibacterium halotolerans]QJR20739.1 nucleotidyl transferase AbiEii/AbiGii toxin family protein [Pelagibacterium halotolerans]
MARKVNNIGASVRARLLARARAENLDFQILLTRYALERLLYRLSISDRRNDFILKGAMLFAVWRDDPFRPTRDLDLLGHGDPEPAAIAESMRSICSAIVPDDGVIFDIDGIEATPIRDEAEYAGVRVRTSATIAGARVPIQIDVGFGDAITPAALEIEYPSLLDAPAPMLRAYPPETVIAEKTEAIVSLGVANSRMKDFYDLWMVSQTFAFEGKALTDAVQKTFERRRTPWPEQLPTGLSDAFASEKDAQWRAFLARDRLAAAPASLIDVADNLRAFLGPVLAREELASWPASGPWMYLEAAE